MKPIDIECPRCGAKQGRQCRSATGCVTYPPHRVRADRAGAATTAGSSIEVSADDRAVLAEIVALGGRMVLTTGLGCYGWSIHGQPFGRLYPPRVVDALRRCGLLESEATATGGRRYLVVTDRGREEAGTWKSAS